MNRVPVNASSPYEVVIGQNILPTLGDKLKSLKADYSKVVLVSDTNVWPLYGEEAVKSLEAAGYTVIHTLFPAGEEAKSLDKIATLTSFLAQNGVTRSDLLVALGGGVCGDLTGFTASIYLRGLDFVQVPTTFLAAVDSSVGGKTGVNIPEGKNLVGAFWQPKLVLCDVSTFKTLPPAVFNDGVAEGIKYGCIWDKDLFQRFLNPNWQENDLTSIVARCVEIKGQVVEQDEKDTGLRQILNFGHTLGHSIEQLSHLEVTHGSGVAIGMCLAAKAGEKAGVTASGTAEEIEKALKLYHLPTKTSYTKEELISVSKKDKKRTGDSINFITLKEIGQYNITPLQVDQLSEFLEGVVS